MAFTAAAGVRSLNKPYHGLNGHNTANRKVPAAALIPS